MKHELTLNDLLTLSDEEILSIGKYLAIEWSEWNTTDHVLYARYSYSNKELKHNAFIEIIKKFNGLSMIGLIREYYQINIYTVGSNWCIQLFDLNNCVNGEQPCMYEDSNKELIDLLFKCVKWMNEQVSDG